MTNNTPKQTHKVFVYGTLRKGFGNNRLLHNAKFISTATTKDKYTMYAHLIPLVAKHPPTSHIVGEVYEVDTNTLNTLDRLEGHLHWYYRELIPVILSTGEEIQAYIYFNDKDKGDIVKSGDYLDYAIRR